MKVVRDMIVIGAGRGGLESMQRVLSALVPPVPAGVIVLLHQLPADFEAAVSQLGNRSSLPVSYAKQGDGIGTGVVYLAPPGCHLLIDEDLRFNLEGGPRLVRSGRPAIDLLFKSAATAFGKRVIGVVLSGADGDGSDGLRAIKAAGGVSVVQSPADAAVPDMPSNAILADDPDHCVRLDQIGPLLGQLLASGGAP